MYGPTRSLTSKPGAGGDDPLLNGPTEGWLHSSGRPGCRTPLVNLLQPLHVQRRVHPRRSHGCWLPSLPGSSFNLNKNPLTWPYRWQSSTDLCRLSACTTDPSGHEPSFKSPRVAHFCFRIFYACISDSLGAFTGIISATFLQRSMILSGVPRQPMENVWKETKEKYIFDREKVNINMPVPVQGHLHI